MARRASFADSIKAQYGQVLFVDNGGFFPEADTHQDVAWFLMDAMKLIGIDAVNVGDRDLRFGISYLELQADRTGLPLVSANLMDYKTKKPALQPYVIKQIGDVKVGVFGLISDKVDLGMSRDSLFVTDPVETAEKTVAELRRKGAQVVVLLSQLGKVESEDLVAAVDGIDAVMVGRNTPLLQKGRMIKNTVACYGGEQGQFICKTTLDLDPQHKVTTGDAVAITLGPNIEEKEEVAKLVKSFEDGFNEKLRKIEAEKAKQHAGQAPANVETEHFLGADVCMRCHTDEAAQWKTTSHSRAWQTLVDAKKDATPDCIPCHVVGYEKPGGFVSGATTPQLGNVQCENCHGMGTQHDAFNTSARRVTAETCMTCHHGENDPEFNWEEKLPKIIHSNMSGETLEHMKNPGGMMKSGDH